jgi:hypothetical protein
MTYDVPTFDLPTVGVAIFIGTARSGSGGVNLKNGGLFLPRGVEFRRNFEFSTPDPIASGICLTPGRSPLTTLLLPLARGWYTARSKV